MISKKELEQLYLENRRSVSYIAKTLKCSENNVNYWLRKYDIPKRSISEALYLKHNPYGNPFKATKPKNIKEAMLLGLGAGLYWAMGSKANKLTVRLAHWDPRLLGQFIQFLKTTFNIKPEKIRYKLFLPGDLEESKAMKYWHKELTIPYDQFQGSSRLATHREPQARENGILSIYYYNKKLHSLICKIIENM